MPPIVAEDSAAYQSSRNIFKIVKQLEIVGYEKPIPDGILYINGLPLVVFEFKSAFCEEATIHDAFVQLTVRYKSDIPEQFKYDAFCMISDGVNSKTDGGDLIEKDGINSLYSKIQRLFYPTRLNAHSFVHSVQQNILHHAFGEEFVAARNYIRLIEVDVIASRIIPWHATRIKPLLF